MQWTFERYIRGYNLSKEDFVKMPEEQRIQMRKDYYELKRLDKVLRDEEDALIEEQMSYLEDDEEFQHHRRRRKRK